MAKPGLPKKYAKMGFKKGWTAYKRSKSGRKGSSGSGRSPRKYRRSPNPGHNPGPRKTFTVGKALDMGALIGPAGREAIHFAYGGSQAAFIDNISSEYTTFVPSTKKIEPQHLVRGYGGAVNRAIEKKVFKALKIRGPRSQIKTIGDIIDYATYFGKSAIEGWENKDNPPAAVDAIYKTQYGIDLSKTGFQAYQPMDMFTEKVLPYVAQKYIRKVLRGAGIKFSM